MKKSELVELFSIKAAGDSVKAPAVRPVAAGAGTRSAANRRWRWQESISLL
jgi:hypothetical protein